MADNKIIFGDVDSSEYDVYISGEGVFNAPERSVTMVTIPGKNGALALDEGRFENIDVTYPAFNFESTMSNFATKLDGLRNALCSKKGYQRLTDTIHTDEYRMAVYRSGLEVDPIKYNTASNFDITFDCKPQRYLTSGEVPQTRTPTQAYTGATTVTGDIVTFTADESIGMSKVTAQIDPIQDLSNGDPSPTNICPISGYSSVKVSRTGKNLFDEASMFTGISNTLRYQSIQVPNGTYTMSTTTPLNNGSANLFFFAGQVTSGASTGTNGVSNGVPRTVTTTNGYLTVCDRILNNQSAYDPRNFKTQIELGSTATTYEPYNGNTYTISTGSAGTVYGGTLDVTTGKLTVTSVMDTLTSSSSISGNGTLTYGGIQILYTPSQTKKYAPTSSDRGHGLLSNRFATGISQSATEGYVNGREGNGNIYFNMPSTVTTVALAQTWFGNNNTQIVYELATPLTYDLTAQEIDTLLGTNNVWSDSGQTTVIYGTNPFYLVNPTLFEAEPLIAITHSGTVKINGTTITNTGGNTETIYIDCESKEIYYYNAGVLTNASSLITFSTADFPKLVPGRNKLELSGVTSVVITPRWWRI